MLRTRFLQLIGELTLREKRKEASIKIAQMLGVSDMMIFVRDVEVNIFLPALGYTQILPEPASWQKFIVECALSQSSIKNLPWPDRQLTPGPASKVSGISVEKKKLDGGSEATECVIAFLGQPSPSEMLTQFIQLLPLLESSMKFEWLAMLAKTTSSTREKEAKKTVDLLFHLERTRRDLQQSLYHSQKALNSRNDFLSVASHELKTPIQSISLEVSLLKRKFEKLEKSDLKERSIEKFESLENHLRRITTLVDNLLDYSQVSEGKLIFNYQKVDISLLVGQIIHRFKKQAASLNVQIHLDSPESAWIFCDISKMDQVVSNLLSNALKYGAHKDIYVGISISENRATVYVRDQGDGIPLTEQNKIFERFERCSADKDISGLGLGLFVVKQIIDGHGGCVEVISEKKKGSTFKINIPLNIYNMEKTYEQVQ